MKFAYLIIAHTRFNQVLKLIKLLDDANNDIYIHNDKKDSDAVYMFQNVLKPSIQKSNIHFVNQHDVVWGSLIETALELLKAVTKKRYDYYHLIFGMDVPIKTQGEIQAFFEKHAGKEIVHFSSNKDARERCQYYWKFQEKIGNTAKAGTTKKDIWKVETVQRFGSEST